MQRAGFAAAQRLLVRDRTADSGVLTANYTAINIAEHDFVCCDFLQLLELDWPLFVILSAFVVRCLILLSRSSVPSCICASACCVPVIRLAAP